MSKKKWLYLLSSNSSKEYLLDIFETLSLPSGVVQHFRYMRRLLNKDINELPLYGENNLLETLLNSTVVVCYLVNDTKKWKSIIPIRTGVMVDVLGSGKDSNDIVHFYFKLENYTLRDKSFFEEMLKEKNITNTKIKYIKGEGIKYKPLVFWHDPLKIEDISDSSTNESAFYRISESIKPKYLHDPTGNIKYYTPFIRFEGISNSKAELLETQYDPVLKKSYYELLEGEKYSFNYYTYSPHQLIPFSVNLHIPGNAFSSPSECCLPVNSGYNRESWPLIPALLEKKIWTVIRSNILTENHNTINSLNLNVDFNIFIKRHLIFRVIDVLGDIGFGLGTGSIALAKIIEDWTWWYWTVVIFYSIWIICKIINKMWRG